MRILIEADSIASPRMSGIGHATLEIIKAFDSSLDFTKNKLVVIVPFGRKQFVAEKYGFKNVLIKTTPPGFKYVNFLLTRTSFPLPVDFYFGRGVYIFPNYKTWYTPFSRSITFVHDVAFKLFPEATNPRNLVYLEKNFQRWLKRASTIVSISNVSTQEVERFFPEVKKKIQTIYLGVDPTVYYPRANEEIVRVRESYGIKNDFFLYVGNIEPRKNILQLLRAYKLYSDKTKTPSQLVLVGGDGWNNEDIVSMIASMQKDGYDVMRPDRYVEDEDLPALYTGSKALFHLAKHEGFGLPPLQAQSCGTPVVVSAIPVFDETLVKGGYAIKVEIDDDTATAVAMHTVDGLKNERTQPTEIIHTWQRTAQNLKELIGEEV